MKICLLLCLLLIANFLFGQQTELVDFLRIEATVTPLKQDKSVQGTYTCTFIMLENAPKIYLDAVDMIIQSAALEGVKAVSEGNKIWLEGPFEAGRTYTTFFNYTASPKQTLYFTEDQIWTQGQGKYTSHWLPSIDDMNDKIEFDLTIVAPRGQKAIANGKNVGTRIDDKVGYWKFDMQNAMASYLVAFAIGEFEAIVSNSATGVPLTHYFRPQDTNKVEPTYRFTTQIFDFLESEIGVPYPWQNYKQVPVRDFLYAGMENTTATFFSEAFVVDSIGYNDRNYINVNAHELAHQWFGNLVTETEGTHHWLHEGFASYYALLAERELFGEDYYYWKLLQTAEQLKELSNQGKGESLLNPKASSLTFYEKGTWALHILKELIGGEAFSLAVKNYLTNHAFKNVTTVNFITEVKAATLIDIAAWEADWLTQSAFQETAAFNSLMKSKFVQDYFTVKQMSPVPIIEKKVLFMGSSEYFSNDFIGQEVVYQLSEEPISETMAVYQKALASDNLYVRQAVALSLQTIPKELQSNFEDLLNDPSYVTKEAALYGLWINFPEKQKTYLDALKDVIGFQDKNVRILWLTLAIITPDYKVSEKINFQNELKGYTATEYSFEVRERAFGFIQELGMYDEFVLKNLVNASIHHNWRFRKYARAALGNVLEIQQYKSILVRSFSDYTEAEQRYLNSLFIK